MKRPESMPLEEVQPILDWWAASVTLSPGVLLHRSATTPREAKRKLYRAWRRMHAGARHDG